MEIQDYIKRLYKIEKDVRKNRVDTKDLVFEGKCLGKIGFVLVRPPPEVPALREEKVREGCQEIYIFSRGIANNLWALPGVIESLTDLREKGLDWGIEKIKIEESCLEGTWVTAVRIRIRKGCLKSYLEEVEKMRKEANTSGIIIKRLSPEHGTDIQEMRSLVRKLVKEKRLIVTNDRNGGFGAACLAELVRTLKWQVPSTADTTLFHERNQQGHYLKMVSILESKL